MNQETQPNQSPEALPPSATEAPQAAPGHPGAAAGPWSRVWLAVVFLFAVSALAVSGLLWERLSTLQGQLARQNADAGANAAEARILARQTQDQGRDLVARLAVMEARLSEVALQRNQLEELMHSLTRSRDESMLLDIDAALRLGLRQSQLSGSVEPVVSALRAAEQRLNRAARPQLVALQRAVARDLARIRATPVVETSSVVARLDELRRMVDELPLANAVAPLTPAAKSRATAGKTAVPAPVPTTESAISAWWQRTMRAFQEEMRGLVRISRIDHPEAVLLAPEQAYFLRENLKLQLLNARMGLLVRQIEASRTDLTGVRNAMSKYFDAASGKTQTALGLLQQVQSQLKPWEAPRLDETLAALAALGDGR